MDKIKITAEQSDIALAHSAFKTMGITIRGGVAPKSYDVLSPLAQAIERGYEKWKADNCHEIGCGCVTVYIYDEVRALLENAMEPTPVTHDRAAKEGEGQALTREQAIVFAERWFDRKWGNDGQYQSLMETMVTRLLAIAATQPPQELEGLREALAHWLQTHNSGVTDRPNDCIVRVRESECRSELLRIRSRRASQETK